MNCQASNLDLSQPINGEDEPQNPISSISPKMTDNPGLNQNTAESILQSCC